MLTTTIATTISSLDLKFANTFIFNIALRLYSPVSSHSRTAKVDATLPRGGGPDGQSPMVVRAGATIVWSTYSLNRDPRRYGEDWAEFRPDRWAKNSITTDATSTTTTTTTTTTISEKDAGNTTNVTVDLSSEGSKKSAFMPFGSGPRTCLGQAMVQAEVTYVMVRLLQEFPNLAMDSADVERPFKEAQAVSFYNEGGVRIQLQ